MSLSRSRILGSDHFDRTPRTVRDDVRPFQDQPPTFGDAHAIPPVEAQSRPGRGHGSDVPALAGRQPAGVGKPTSIAGTYKAVDTTRGGGHGGTPDGRATGRR